MPRSRALTMDGTAPRARTRTPAEQPDTGGPTPQMLEQAQSLYEANKQKNAASVAERKAKDALHKLMVKNGVENFEFPGRFNGAVTPTEVAIEETVDTIMDVEKLRELLDDDLFMQVISATKTAVKEKAGEHIVMQAEKEIVKPASLKMRKAS